MNVTVAATAESVTVICVAPPGLDFVFGPIVRELRALNVPGVEVLRAHDVSPGDGRLRRARILVPWSGFRCTRELIGAAPALKAIICPFVGVEGVDREAATERGVMVANGATPESAASMAEATIMLILATAYDLKTAERKLREPGAGPDQGSPRLLQGRTIGLIGFGRIGSAIAQRLAPWGLRLVASTRDPSQPLPVGLERASSIDWLLAESDVVCLLTPLTDSTRGLLGERELRLLKEDAILINTARGGLVDEEALAKLAAERPRFRFALDTFAREPLPADSPLREAPGAILTPHCVGHTAEMMSAIVGRVVESTRRVLRDELPIGLIDAEAAPLWLRTGVLSTADHPQGSAK